MRISAPGVADAPGLNEPIREPFVEVRITKAEVRTSKKGDSQYISWEGTVFWPAPLDGRKVFWTNSLKQEARSFLKNTLESAGVTMDAEGFDTEECLGKPVRLSLKVRPESPNPDGGTYPERTEVVKCFKPEHA